MRMAVQRVQHASVVANGALTGEIGRGLLVLVGISPEDNPRIVQKMTDKLLRLRIFPDAQDKINLSVQDVAGGILLVSQFTLYADCRKGNRPSFTAAAPPAQAEALYQYCHICLLQSGLLVQTGIFGADMQVTLCNDGPFTVWLDSAEVVR